MLFKILATSVCSSAYTSLKITQSVVWWSGQRCAGYGGGLVGSLVCWFLVGYFVGWFIVWLDGSMGGCFVGWLVRYLFVR